MQELLNYIWQHQDAFLGALGAIVAALIVPLSVGSLMHIRYRRSRLRARRQLAYAERQQRKEEQAQRIKAERQLTQLSLFAIARTTLEADDRAIVGKTYTVQAGVSQNRPEDFRGEPFTVSVQNPLEPLLFGILFHPSENIELIGAQYQPLRYDPRDVQPQLISCPFRLKAPGQSHLLINFYRERQWLKTIRFEFDGIEQSLPSTAMHGR